MKPTILPLSPATALSTATLAGHEGLLDVDGGGGVGGAALQEAELDAADLGAGALLDDRGEQAGEAAELGVAEAVGGAGLGLGDEAAVGVVDALADGDEAVAALTVDALDVGDEAGPCRSPSPAGR